MTPPGSVSRWLPELLVGNPDAIQAIWERYFTRLVELARHRLRAVSRVAADEEDVALVAFDTFFRNAAAGRFPQLRDRDDLWRILLMITDRKATTHIRHETRQKRNAEHLQLIDQGEGEPLEPSSDFVVQVAEEYQRLLQILDNENLRTVALMKMEKYTSGEIAKFLGCSERTVERKLQVIRSIWLSEREQ